MSADAIQAITAAIKSMSDEHGLPNRFSAEEVANGTGMHRLKIGTIARNYTTVLRQSLSGAGLRLVAYERNPPTGHMCFVIEQGAAQ